MSQRFVNRFHYCQISKFWFFKSALFLSDQFWANILYVREFLLAKSLQKTCLYVHEKLQRNPSVGSCLKISIFRPYGFDYFGFLTNARRGAMRSKTQWVIYRDLDWWPGPQKVQFGEITGYPEVVGLILALLIILRNPCPSHKILVILDGPSWLKVKGIFKCWRPFSVIG